MTLIRWGMLALAAVGSVLPAAPKEIDRFTVWHYEADTDPMTDEAKFNAWLPADDEDALLVIGCAGPGVPLKIAVKFSTRLGGPDGYRDFMWRSGSRDAVTEQWAYVGGAIAGIHLPPEDSPLRKALVDDSALKVRATTSTGSTVDASFHTGGDDGAITRLLIDCKLDPRFP